MNSKPTPKLFVLGPLETNAYVVSQDSVCLIVDPSSGCGKLLNWITEQSLSPQAILLTHAHFDHVMGIDEVQRSYPGLPVWVHPADRILLEDSEKNGSVMLGQPYSYNGPLNLFEEGPVSIGGIQLSVIHTPGHTPGGCSLLFDSWCLTGDTLFARSIGRSDFPGGDGELLLRSIRTKLLTLPEEIVVYPGHGGATKIGFEKRTNPFLQ